MWNRRDAIAHTYEYALKGFAAKLSPEQVEALRKDPAVSRVEPDVIVHAMATQSDATWGIDRVDQHALPLSHTYTYSATGSGVSVYIIDTGIRYTHTEFGGRAHLGYDAFGGSGTDCSGHGTHVAGTVGGRTYGIAKEVTLYSVRVLECDGSAPLSDIIAGIDWVTKNRHRPAVANLSLGAGLAPLLDSAVARSIRAGVTYVVAAGNGSMDACKMSPGHLPQVITVGAVGATDARMSWSNYGSCVDLFAPGDHIRSSDYYSDVSTAMMAGTSMAAPHVSGVAALYLQLHPSASPAEVQQAIVGNATTGRLTNLAGSANRLVYSGFIGGSSSSPTTPTSSDPVAKFTSSCSGLTCVFDASASTAPNGVLSRSWYFGDGYAAGGVKVSHTYPAAKSYTVTFVLVDQKMNRSTVTQTISVGTGTSQSPSSSATFSASCSRHTCWFGPGALESPDVKYYSWYFGDGYAAGGKTVEHTYRPGTYTVTLMTTDVNRTNTKYTKVITITD